MTAEATPDKTDTVESLTLRARPRPVSRLSRKAILGASAAGAGLIFGAMLFTLKPPSVRTADPALLPTSTAKPTTEAIDRLPSSYEEAATLLPSGPMPAPIPRLGPPLPGDLGSGVYETERALGIDAADDLQAYDDARLPFLPDAENESARVERIRQARMTAEAREAGVFFALRGGDALTNEEAALGLPAAIASIKSDVVRTPPIGRSYLAPGTVIRASLLTAINSDLPGTAIAQVTEDVTDSETGMAVLIPSGARVIGRYGSEVGAYQSRADIRWNRLVFPNGEEVELADLPAVDPTGAAGLEDEVDRHTGRLIRAGLISSLLGVGSELTIGGDGESARAVQQALQGTTNVAGQALVQRGVSAEPTLRIRAGFEFALVLERALPLSPYKGTER